jgi:hypothetical protein
MKTKGKTMQHDLMAKCERKALFKINNDKVWKWVEAKVTDLLRGEQPEIRCIHCHGRVRVYKQKLPHGPQDHVEHILHQDSENCCGGYFFKGEHRMSLNPVS